LKTIYFEESIFYIDQKIKYFPQIPVEMCNTKPPFPPNLKNKTTSARKQMNEVMRLGMLGNSFATEVVPSGKLGRNEVLKTIYFEKSIFYIDQTIKYFPQILVEMCNTKTSFLPNFKNKTTSVAVARPYIPPTSLPH
jgi:hypothetical protein